MNEQLTAFLIELRRRRARLTRQQYSTIKGQALSGNLDAARKGFEKILKRGGQS